MSIFISNKSKSLPEYVYILLGLLVTIGLWAFGAEMLSQQKPIVEGESTVLPSFLDTTITKFQRDSIIKADSLKLASATKFEKVYPILPPPQKVVMAYKDLYYKDELANNLLRSFWLNLQGYLWAILIALPIGFLIGLIPVLKGMFSKQVDALRYLPLSALTGLFIVWFGIEDKMKIAFLAFGILVYLLPVVVQRIMEVENVYLQTSYTLGAKFWQTLRTVHWPAIFSKIIDDIRVLTAISWTYIIIAELLNRQGGIGALIFLKSKMGQIDKVFAILLLIIAVGFLQDRIFAYLDRRLCPHKYFKSSPNGLQEAQYGIYLILLTLLLKTFLGAIMPSIGVWIGAFAGIAMIAMGEIKIQGEKSA